GEEVVAVQQHRFLDDGRGEKFPRDLEVRGGLDLLEGGLQFAGQALRLPPGGQGGGLAVGDPAALARDLPVVLVAADDSAPALQLQQVQLPAAEDERVDLVPRALGVLELEV